MIIIQPRDTVLTDATLLTFVKNTPDLLALEKPDLVANGSTTQYIDYDFTCKLLVAAFVTTIGALTDDYEAYKAKLSAFNNLDRASLQSYTYKRGWSVLALAELIVGKNVAEGTIMPRLEELGYAVLNRAETWSEFYSQL